MKKITAIILAVVVLIGGFGAGNAYRSICKAEAVTQDNRVVNGQAQLQNRTNRVADKGNLAKYKVSSLIQDNCCAKGQQKHRNLRVGLGCQ